MKLITPGVVELVKMAKEGKFPGGNYFGGAGLASFHDFDAKIAQNIKDELKRIDAGLKDGSITTGYGQ
jgi:basic membrane protein A